MTAIFKGIKKAYVLFFNKGFPLICLFPLCCQAASNGHGGRQGLRTYFYTVACVRVVWQAGTFLDFSFCGNDILKCTSIDLYSF